MWVKGIQVLILLVLVINLVSGAFNCMCDLGGEYIEERWYFFVDDNANESENWFLE